MNSNTTAAIMVIALAAVIAFAVYLDHKETMARIAAGQCHVRTDNGWQWEPCQSSGRE